MASVESVVSLLTCTSSFELSHTPFLHIFLSFLLLFAYAEFVFHVFMGEYIDKCR